MSILLSSILGRGLTWPEVDNNILNLSQSFSNYAELGTSVAFTSVNINGTAGNGHLHLRWQSSEPSGTGNANTIFATSSSLGIKIDGSGYSNYLTFPATSSATYTYPSSSGTLALVGDINTITGSFLPLVGGKQMTGDISFSGSVKITSSYNVLGIFSGSSEYIPADSSLVGRNYGPYYSNTLRTYNIGSGTYNDPQYTTIIQQSDTETAIYGTNKGKSNGSGSLFSVSPNTGIFSNVKDSNQQGNFQITTTDLRFAVSQSNFTNYIKLSHLPLSQTHSIQFPASDGIILLDSTISGSYAKLDGSNTPFTGAIRFEPTIGTAVTAKAFSTNPIYVGRDSSNVEKFRVNSSGLIDVYSTTNNFFFRAFAGANEFSISEFSSRWVLQGDSRPLTFSFINNMTFSLRATNGTFDFGNDAGGSTVRLQTVNNQNSIIAINGIKIGNNTDAASVAGAGSIKYNSSTLSYSDGVNWNSVSVASNFSLHTFDVCDTTAQVAPNGTTYWMKVVSPFTGTVDKIGCLVTSVTGESIHMGIYNKAGSVIQSSSIGTGIPVSGINTASLSGTVSLVAGTEYWLAVKADGTGSISLGSKTVFGNANICNSQFIGAGAVPSTTGSATIATDAFYVFAFKS